MGRLIHLRCPECGFENRKYAGFCEECGYDIRYMPGNQYEAGAGGFTNSMRMMVIILAISIILLFVVVNWFFSSFHF